MPSSDGLPVCLVSGSCATSLEIGCPPASLDRSDLPEGREAGFFSGPFANKAFLVSGEGDKSTSASFLESVAV